MIYKICFPSLQLAGIVEYYWYSRKITPHSIVQSCPTPLLHGLAFSFQKNDEYHAFNGKTVHLYKKGYFFGQPTCPRTITYNATGEEIIGVKFKPPGIAQLTGVNMEHLTDACVAAEDIWGSAFELLHEEMQSAADIENRIAVLEKFLTAKFSRVKQAYYFKNVSNALEMIRQSAGSMRISEIQRQTNTTRRTLERNFAQAIGLKPKLYAQIVRFNAAKEELDQLLTKQKISDVAYHFGYFNNSHLAAAFKRFSGLSPNQYLKSKLA